MNTADAFQKMALNNAWANATLYGAVFKLPDGAFLAPAPGFFGSVKETLNHIHQVDLFYLDALEQGGKGRAVFGADEVEDPKVLAQEQSHADMRFAQFCGGLDEARLRETRSTERKDGPVMEQVGAMVMHLVQHQIHHRGQAHVQMQHLGVAPPQLDEFYLEYERAPSAQAYFG